MSALAKLYVFKIVATLCCWSLPLLLLSHKQFTALGIPTDHLITFRLLGWAYLSLCVGYIYGLYEELHHRHNWAPILMGIVSNAGAAYLLGRYIVSARLWEQAWPLALFTAGSTGAATIIAAGLAAIGYSRKHIFGPQLSLNK